ncbi:MAG: adenosylcobalamin-dependent ribonucleoside-diphosphate reductase, partial [Candidatus Nanoarchaeia archaeon]
QPIEDDLMSIYGLVQDEARLFKYGSGTGTNFSTLRSKFEKLSGGGTSSGLMSFLEVFDRAAGATKSGGTTRRAAKMVCLDMDHPEILDFIRWKSKEELKAKALIAAGYDSDFNGEAYKTVSGQNSNNSIRITDKFMESYQKDGKWKTIARTTGETIEEFDARFLMKELAKAAWSCADPGVQFDTTSNEWHTCPNTDRIYASNPCSEFMFLDNSACNLASINLLKFTDESGKLDIEAFQHASRVFFIAQEIIVAMSSYPTAKIAQKSYEYRPLGLGYANLGTVLMINGIPYDSPQALAWAGAITAILTGHSYRTSAELAAVMGPFQGFQKNREPMLRVMNKHRDAAYRIDVRHCPEDLLKAAREDWDDAVELGEQYGYRNAQATLLAPTGTVGLLMDCATTGIEPEFSLVKWKKLAGGGYFKIINNTIPQTLRNLGYTQEQIDEIVMYILGDPSLERAPHLGLDKLKSLGFTEEQISEAQKHLESTGSLDQYCPHVNPKSLKLTDKQLEEAQLYIGGAQTIEGAPHFKEEHYAVFDCANRCGNGERYIDPMGHVRMMAAVQPFLSGAISKTINLTNEATVEDIENIYVESWRLGLKAVALYRDGCKSSQPLNTSTDSEGTVTSTADWGLHKPLPSSRQGLMVDTNIAGHNIFLRTGEYEDGSLGEVEVQMHKEGSIMNAFMKTFSKAVSIGLQHGVPLKKYVDTFTFTRFQPSGMTNHPNIKTCTSVPDFMFRVLGLKYLKRDDLAHVKPVSESVQGNVKEESKVGESALSDHLEEMMGDAPACNECGHITVRNGTCYRCLNCGNSMGCS